jgi:hypothetical protein
MATTSHLYPTNTSLAARGNVSLTPGSHIWFRSLEFIITGEGDDLDLVPPTGEPASFSEPAANLRLHFDELKGTWTDKFSYPDPLRQASDGQPRHRLDPGRTRAFLEPKTIGGQFLHQRTR